MSASGDTASRETASDQRIGVNGRTPVFLICSPRPRVGKTLIARLLIEFFVFDGRSVAAFDASPNDASLSRYLPDCTVPATISDIRSQMTLFDQLIVNDATPKVIDLAAGQFDSFFTLMGNIGFLDEATKQAVSPVVIFVPDRDPVCAQAYEMIWRRFLGALLVPVHNQAIMPAWHYANFPTPANRAPLRIPGLPWTLNGIVNKKDFSFTEFLDTPVNFPTELHEWINRCFVAFRELQLCILMENFRPLFSRGCTHHDVHWEAREGDGFENRRRQKSPSNV
jgi:hypothetical protein